MSRSKKQRRQQSAPAASPDKPKIGDRQEARPPAGRVKVWWRSKDPIIRFVAIFGLLMGLYYAATVTDFFHHRVFPAYLRFNARICSPILNWFQQSTSAFGSNISSGRFSIDIARGCDAIEPAVFFASAVLAFPAMLRRKISGLVVGALLLLVLNLVRIISLFLVGVYYPNTFHAMHAEVWQVIFILLAIVFWVLWMQWATRPRPSLPEPNV